MKLPSSGTLLGDTSNMRDPHKFGSVMWARTNKRYMVPLDLHGRLSESDEMSLDIVFIRLRTFRKVIPALEAIRSRMWLRLDLIKPYLISTMEGRSEARSMMADGSWEYFWSSLE